MSEENLGELNRHHMNKVADFAFTQQWIIDLGDQITTYLISHLEWLGIPSTPTDTPIKLLDYACGNGLISKALSPYVSTIRGIDVSDSMVEKYNEWASSQHISQEVIFGIRGDLLAPSAEMEKLLQTSAYSEFDIIIISMALHHVADPKLMLKELVVRMVDGGRILVIDWNKEEDTEYGEPVAGVLQKGDWKDVKRTIKKQRFSESEVVSLLKSAGCREVEFVLSDEVSKLPMEFGGKERMFFGLGRK